MTRIKKLLLALPLLAAWGCQDTQPVTAPDTGPIYEIAHGGSLGSSENFTFLAPLVTSPAVSGNFDPNVNPTVLICELSGSVCGSGPYVAGFLRTIGTTRIQVNAAAEAYEVSWNTRRFNLDPAKMYRIRVYAGGREVGHVDLDVVANEAEAAAVNRAQFAPVVRGSTLPIRFRFVTGGGGEPPRNGTVTGRVIDAITANPISGATVDFGDGRTVTTAGNGTFSIALPPGSYTASASRSGYGSTSVSATVTSDATTNVGDVPLSPELAAGQLRVVLTWGATPSDLDSHLTGPLQGGGRFHVFFTNPGSLVSTPFANLDRDDTNQFGPETITITQFFGGTYRYSVHDYSNRFASASNALAGSGATVRVFRGDAQVAQYSVPNQAGTLWTVFELNGSTGAITAVNSMSYVSSPGAVMSITTSGSGATAAGPRTDAAVIGAAVAAHPKAAR